jgi:hypothetical protein
MSSAPEHSGIARILRSLGDTGLVHRLATDVAPADHTTLLLAVAAERAAQVDAPGVIALRKAERLSYAIGDDCASSLELEADVERLRADKAKLGGIH